MTKGEIELVFPKFPDEDKMTESEICVRCHGCCMYVTVPLDSPRSKDQKDLFRWYLLHRNVEIYIDHDRQWQILFKTPCTKLLDNGMCAVYETRPQICRDYKADACSRVGKDYIELFKTQAELDLYFESRKSATAKKTAPKTAGKTAKKASKKAIKKSAKNAAKKSTKKAVR